MSENTGEENSPSAGPESSAGTEKYLVFTIQERRYALPAKLIGEAAALEKVFPLPLVPPYVRGIINRYSIPYALIDIGFLLLKTFSAAAKLIVLKEKVDRLAFLIDDVTDIADIPPESLLQVEQEDSQELPSGLIAASFEWKGNHVFCLALDELVNQIKKDFEG
ncbi:MAG: chemotaxis protein CheW [Treponema sp.]|jgi:purine-binding chemotaxis protein CheW|nr:chemotaxis protein CheW [Treponema sp.]